MTFAVKMLLSVDLILKLFSFLFNKLPLFLKKAYSKASKLGKACSGVISACRVLYSEVLKRVDVTGGLLSTSEHKGLRLQSIALQRSSSFEAFEYALQERDAMV